MPNAWCLPESLRHPWSLQPAEARQIQSRLREWVVQDDAFGPVRRVAGTDVGFEKQGAITRAAVVVLDIDELRPLEHAISRVPTHFPYIPGLLSFRELPAVLAALEQLHTPPDLILCDGQGYAHPRRFGLACHLGVWTGLPCIGVAKSRLVGCHGELPQARGSWVPLMDKGETIGAVLRTRQGVTPLYVSVGHRIGLLSAIQWVLACCRRYRLPETTRHAHRLASGPPL